MMDYCRTEGVGEDLPPEILSKVALGFFRIAEGVSIGRACLARVQCGEFFEGYRVPFRVVGCDHFSFAVDEAERVWSVTSEAPGSGFCYDCP